MGPAPDRKSACGRSDPAAVRGVRARSVRPERRGPPRRACASRMVVLCGNSNRSSASAEGDDAANGVVRRDADGHPVTRNDFDPEAAHPAAELREHLVALVALDAIQAAAVDRHDRALHIYQIILAQLLSFPIKECATFAPLCKLHARFQAPHA